MNNYRIGKYLKRERKNRQLNQKQFLHGVLSISQYSRIENEEQDIRMMDFIQIMYLNKIDFIRFFDQFQNDNGININSKNKEEKILEKLAQLFYDQDLVRIKEMKEEVLDKKTLALKWKLIIAILEGNLNSLDNKFKIEFSEELNKSDNLTEDKDFLQLFSSSMQLFNIERLNIYMKKILLKYRDNINKENFEVQRRIASIGINYLAATYNQTNKSLFNEVILLLNNLSENPDLLMYKMLRLYFIYLKEGKKQQLEEILTILKEAGYSRFINNLPKNL